MPINQLQLPNYGNVPQVDFSSLAQLPDVYRQGQRAATLADLGKDIQSGKLDYQTAAGKLIAAGDIPTGLAMLQTAEQKKALATFAGSYGQPAAPVSPPSFAPTSSDPRGIRNNNPLNIEAGPFTQSQPGFAGSDGRFARFDAPEQGVNAASKLIDTYGSKYGLNTVAGIVNRWAPSKENGQATSNYATSVAQALGVDPNAPLNLSDPNVKNALIQAMGKFENGRPIGQAMAFSGEAQPGSAPVVRPQAPQAPQGAPGLNPQLIQALPHLPPAMQQAVTAQLFPQFGFQTLPDGRIARTNPRTGSIEVAFEGSKPSFSVIGKDQNGNDVHGFVDVSNRKVYDLQGNPVDGSKLAGGVGGGANPGLTGDAFLQTLDPGRANQIKAIADGRMSPPGGFALKSPQIQGLLRDVAQYEPGFDLTSWTARNKTRADFSSGKMAQNLTAFNTAIGHLETLDKAASNLNNSSFPYYNSVANWVISNKGDPRVKEFEVAKTAVADELTRAFRGTGGNVHDLIQWENSINAAGSPDQLKSVIKQATELLSSRIEAVGDQYNKGMGKTTDPVDLLSSRAKVALQKLRGDRQPAPTGSPSQTVTPPAPATAPRAALPQGYTPESAIAEAKAAIAAGKDPAVIAQRLKGMGIDPGGL